MKVRFKKLTENAVVPTKAHATDAGFDLTATSTEYVAEKKMMEYGTGIAVEIPAGYVGLVFPRSSIYKTGMTLSNAVGVIDSGYRGEIKAKFYDVSGFREPYAVGDRIAQLVIIPYPEIEWEQADELSDSDRGTNGYGSTGVSKAFDEAKPVIENVTYIIKGETIPCKKVELIDFNILSVTAGTTGYRGGDSGHGGRTMLKIQDEGCTDIDISILTDKGMVEKWIRPKAVQISLGGDSEMKTFIKALEFALKTYKEQMK